MLKRFLASAALVAVLGVGVLVLDVATGPHVVQANAATVYTTVVAVTPSDATVLAPTTALWIGGTGTLAVQMADGTSGTFSAVPAGYLLPVSVTKVKSTGTSATLILALD